MTLEGIDIPDKDKVEIPKGEKADEATWIELTDHRGKDDPDE